MDTGQVKKSHTWRTESCRTAGWLAVCHTFSGLDNANKFTIFFILLLPHISTQRKNEKKEKIEKKKNRKEKKGKKKGYISHSKARRENGWFCINSHLSPCSRSQTKCAACIIIPQPHSLLAQFALGDMIWHLIACMHIPASNMCLLYIFDSNSLLLVYKNQMIWNEKVFRLSASMLAQRSSWLRKSERMEYYESPCLIPAVVWHDCCWQGADHESGGKCTVLGASAWKKSEWMFLKQVDNSKPGVSNELSVYVKHMFILRVA